MSKYPADWDEIGKVVELRNQINSKTLIIGNGDVKSQAEISEKTTKHGVDGVMIGRGIFGNPFLFNNESPQHIDELTPLQKIQLLEQHLHLFETRWGENTRYATMKRFYKIYINNFPDASSLRAKMMETNNPTEADAVLSIFKNEQNSNLSNSLPF